MKLTVAEQGGSFASASLMDHQRKSRNRAGFGIFAFVYKILMGYLLVVC
ncbi:MAG: hypothetical protein IJC78_03025 [Clostridia bacterium]|nr:hypothetical protein [Clostridia bacterium]